MPFEDMTAGAEGSNTRSTFIFDQSLHSFLAEDFDPTEFLNAAIPPLYISVRPTQVKNDGTMALPELAAQTQTLLAQLNAQTTGMSNSLTQMTDEILRSGSRLAYEVDLLRAESLNLSETVAEHLTDDVKCFVPAGLNIGQIIQGPTTTQSTVIQERRKSSAGIHTQDDASKVDQKDPTIPPYLTQLRTLSLVKSRLEKVIEVFGDAMQWTLSPSEVSLGSSFISVAAPEPGSDSHSQEERGQEVAKKLRAEVSLLLYSGEDEEAALERTVRRVKDISDLAQVWRGTVEERARMNFVTGLLRRVEERQRELERAAAKKQIPEKRSSKTTSPRERVRDDREADEQKRFGWAGRPAGYGLIDQLQKMRGASS